MKCNGNVKANKAAHSADFSDFRRKRRASRAINEEPRVCGKRAALSSFRVVSAYSGSSALSGETGKYPKKYTEAASAAR